MQTFFINLTARHWSCLSVSLFSLADCSPLVLSLCFFILTCRLLATGPVNTLVCTILLSKQQMPLPTMLLLYRFCQNEICICCKLCPTRDKTHDLQITLPTMLTLSFYYTSGTLHARHIQSFSNFEVGHFARHFLFLSFLL